VDNSFFSSPGFLPSPAEEFMSKELVVSSNRHETRVAVLEDDQLVEIYFQRQQEYSLAGSIHKGRVTRVLPGMQSAFVDIGLERDAFLYVSDFFEDNEEYDQVVSNVEDQVLRLEKGAPAAAEAAIDLQTATKIDPVRAAATQAFEPVSATPAPRLDRPAGPSGADRDGRDRRGRRPRRRRGKGRGFPDSKYAPATPVPAEATSDTVEPAEAFDNEEEELPVLPGETISKYRHSDSATQSTHESDDSEGIAVEAAVVEEAPQSARWAPPEEVAPAIAVAERETAIEVVSEPEAAIAVASEPEPRLRRGLRTGHRVRT
jgi:ribonuclease G